MKKKKFYWIVIFPLLISCHYLFPTSSKEPVPKEPAIDGTWKLISYQGTDPSGRIYYPLGDSVIGQMQLDTSGRGFSFSRQGPLDMRFSPGQTESAAEILDSRSVEQLAHILQG